jgi:hypothetical protein
MNHWIMNDPGGPSQGGVNEAFAQAISESRPVVYAWYMHERDDMRGNVAAAHSYLQAAAAANPGVPFKYVTAQEAMRAIIGTTDVTPPTLAIARAGGDTYTITSTEALWGSGPYVAGRYGSGSGAIYTHVSASASGPPNTWTATLPATNGGLPLALVGAGALDQSGNGATKTLSVESANAIAAVVPGGACISTAHACVAVPVTFTRADATPVRAYSVQLHLSSELAVCGAGIEEGSYLSNVGGTSFQVVSQGGGSYEVDGAILGAPCGATGNGTLFTLALSSAAAGGTGTITVDYVRVRDCDNNLVPGEPGLAASLPIDNTAPAAVTGLTAAAGTAGSHQDGRINVAVSFTAPSDGSRLEVYRKGFGNHPVYGPGTAPEPAPPPSYPPSSDWVLTGVSAGVHTDDPPTRDYWYYVAYAIDECGNASPVSARTGGALNYLLGDVAGGTGTCGGNSTVSTADVSLLGAHYGQKSTDSDYLPCLDVGPTTDYGLWSRPTPDGVIEFEDLVLFALNYTGLGGPGALPAVAGARARVAPAAASADAVGLEVPVLPGVGETFTVTLRASGKSDVQALGLDLDYDGSIVELEKVEGGELLARQASEALVLSPKPGRIDVALLGKGAGLSGEGTLATATFRVLAAGDAKLRLASVDGRDGRNRKVTLGATTAPVVPTVTLLSPARPNPFAQTVTLSFSLAQAGPADLVIYSVSGRRVRTLAHGAREPGVYDFEWDGRDDAGSAVAAGVYYAHLATVQRSFTLKLTYLK